MPQDLNQIPIEHYQSANMKETQKEIVGEYSSILTIDRAIVLILFLFTLFSRIPFQSQILYHWDSVNFAAAINQFDLANESPHPPGYIVYVWLTQAINLIFNDPQRTMVSISMLSSALAVVALFLLGKAMFNRSVGIIAGLFLATSPMFWFYGEIALPHTLDTVFVITSVLLLYLTMRGDYQYLLPAILTVAVAGGLRPQTLVFLLPLVLFSIRKAGIKRIISAGMLGAIACVLWFVPLVTASGGFSTYIEIMGRFSDRFQESTSIFMGAGWAGVQGNLSKVIAYTAYGLTLTVLPMLAYGIWLINKGTVRKIFTEKMLFLFIWMAPVLFFYIAIHMGQQGLIFVYLPALLLLAAVGLYRLFFASPMYRTAAVVLIVLFNIGFFTLAPEYPVGTQRMLTSDTLRNSDRYFGSRIEAIEYNFEASQTGVIARDWRHVSFYLSDFTIIPLDDQKWSEFSSLDALGYIAYDDFPNTRSEVGAKYIVLFDRELENREQSPDGRLKAIDLVNGEKLLYYELRPQDKLYLKGNVIELVQEQR
jgi:hypothetical protein